jgi:hypothetical protein
VYGAWSEEVENLNGGGDFLSAMGWGLRRYAVLVVACTVGLGVAVPLLLLRGPAAYDAEAQVGPSGPIVLHFLDALARVGDSVFNNGAVAATVRHTLHLGPSAAVVPDDVELIAEQDNPVFTVVGHSTSAATAQAVANAAATTFAREFNKYSGSVATLQVQHHAPRPAKPVAKLACGKVGIGIGLGSGLIAGVAAMMLLLVWRRPILDTASAQEGANIPVYGQVRLPRTSTPGETRAPTGLNLLCRRLNSNPEATVLLVGPESGSQVQQLGAAMGRHFSRAQGRSNVDLRVGSGGQPEQVATLPESALTLLVVPKGIWLNTLRQAAGENLTSGAAGLVMVSREGGRRK